MKTWRVWFLNQPAVLVAADTSIQAQVKAMRLTGRGRLLDQEPSKWGITGIECLSDAAEAAERRE